MQKIRYDLAAFKRDKKLKAMGAALCFTSEKHWQARAGYAPPVEICREGKGGNGGKPAASDAGAGAQGEAAKLPRFFYFFFNFCTKNT